MTGRRALTLVVVLAVLAVAGIVAMLIVEGTTADGAAFVVAALPLAAGGWSCWSRRGAADQKR